MGKDRDRSSPPIEIYGPQGLREWLRIAIRYNYARVVPNYIVHELMNTPMASLDSSNNMSFDYKIDKFSWVNRCNIIKFYYNLMNNLVKLVKGKIYTLPTLIHFLLTTICLFIKS